MTARLADTISGLFLIVLALVAGVAAQFLPTTIAKEFAGPSFMPTLLSIALAICGAGIVFQARSLPPTNRMPGWFEADRAGAVRIAVVAAATAAYNFLLEPLGIFDRYLCFPRLYAFLPEGVVVLKPHHKSYRHCQHLCAIRHLAQGCAADGAPGVLLLTRGPAAKLASCG